MGWLNAYARGFIVFLYFLVATVIVPNLVLRLDAVGGSSQFLQDVIVLLIWGAGLVAGIYLLRRFQRQGLI